MCGPTVSAALPRVRHAAQQDRESDDDDDRGYYVPPDIDIRQESVLDGRRDGDDRKGSDWPAKPPRNQHVQRDEDDREDDERGDEIPEAVIIQDVYDLQGIEEQRAPNDDECYSNEYMSHRTIPLL